MVVNFSDEELNNQVNRMFGMSPKYICVMGANIGIFVVVK